MLIARSRGKPYLAYARETQGADTTMSFRRPQPSGRTPAHPAQR
jgi:hypothetical protein